MANRALIALLSVFVISSSVHARGQRRVVKRLGRSVVVQQTTPSGSVLSHHDRKLQTKLRNEQATFAPILEAYKKVKIASSEDYARALSELRAAVVQEVNNGLQITRGWGWTIIMCLLTGIILYFIIVRPITNMYDYKGQPVNHFCFKVVPHTISNLRYSLKNKINPDVECQVETFIADLEAICGLISS